MGSLSEEVRTEVLCGHICDLEAENAKLRELLLKSFELMHRGGLTTGAYGPCMELFEEAEDIGVIVPFMSELGIEV